MYSSFSNVKHDLYYVHFVFAISSLGYKCVNA